MSIASKQKKELRERIRNGKSDFYSDLESLMNAGMSENDAAKEIKNAIDEYRKELFDKKVQQEKQEELRKGMVILVVVISIIGPVAEIYNPFWYILAMVINGTCGYFAFQNKPIAGILGFLTITLILPFSFLWYFSNRSSYFRIEMIIPLFIACAPAYAVYEITSKLMYKKTKI
jgi:magnesium-transporting ATPase (P-type)